MRRLSPRPKGTVAKRPSLKATSLKTQGLTRGTIPPLSAGAHGTKTDKTTVYDLFQMQRRYVVPLFQRGYVWTQERQWEPLWADLVAQAAETVRHRRDITKSLHKHFLGAVVLNLTLTMLRRVPVVEIIDGQQRLTTLQVLLAAVRNETTHIDNAFMRADLVRLTSNQGPFSAANEKFKVWPTSAMQEHVARLIETGSTKEIEAYYAAHHIFRYGKWRPARPPIVEAYLYFSAQVRALLDDDPEELPYDLLDSTSSERAEALVEALLHHIQLVTIELEQEDDAQVIFETLNARGEPLTPSDLVRNFVFLTATRQDLDVTRLYTELWEDFEEGPVKPPFWKVEERQGRLKRSRLDLFLFHYVTFLRKEELKIGYLYQGFRDWWDAESDRNIEQELRELRRHSLVYQQLLSPVGKSRLAEFGRRIRAIDTSTANPVVLLLADLYGSESPQLDTSLTQLESYLIRRSVCGYNQKAYNKIFLDLLKGLDAHGRSNSNYLQEFLSTSKADSVLWPSNEEFRDALIRTPVYRNLRSRGALMLLEAIEDQLQHVYSEDITINSPLSVEHIMPQTGDASHWPVTVESDESDSDAAIRRDRIIHTLGNLTLLTQPLNSSVSNGPFTVPDHPNAGKRYSITYSSRLSLNRYFDSIDHWDEAAITRRGAALADRALKIWPGPA